MLSRLRFSPTRVKNWCRNIGNGLLLAARTVGVMVFEERLRKRGPIKVLYRPGAPTGLTQPLPANFWGCK